jgi:hypothetical protein
MRKELELLVEALDGVDSPLFWSRRKHTMARGVRSKLTAILSRFERPAGQEHS